MKSKEISADNGYQPRPDVGIGLEKNPYHSIVSLQSKSGWQVLQKGQCLGSNLIRIRMQLRRREPSQVGPNVQSDRGAESGVGSVHRFKIGYECRYGGQGPSRVGTKGSIGYRCGVGSRVSTQVQSDKNAGAESEAGSVHRFKSDTNVGTESRSKPCRYTGSIG